VIYATEELVRGMDRKVYEQVVKEFSRFSGRTG